MKKLFSIIISLIILLAIVEPSNSATPLIDNAFKITDQKGRPVPGGQVFTYEPGTTTPKITYSDEAGTIPHPNPVSLDSEGKEMIYGNGAYTIDVKDLFGSQVNGWPKLVDSYVTNTDFVDANESKITKIYTIPDLRTHTGYTGESVQVLGYYTAGDGGGGPLKIWNEGQIPGFYTDDGYTTFVPGDGSAAWIMNQEDFEARPEWAGCKGDSITIDSVPMAIFAALPGRKLMSRHYKLDDQIEFHKDSVVTFTREALMDFDGATGSFPNSACVFAIGSTATTLPALAQDVSLHDNELVFVSAISGVVKGDIIRIENPADGSWSGFRPDYRAGEMCRVHSIETTTIPDDTIRLQNVTFDAYLAADVDVYLQNDPATIKTKGLRVRGIGPTSDVVPVNIWDGDNVIFENPVIDNGKSKSLNFTRCLGTRVDNPKINLIHPNSGTNYGITIANCQDLIVTNPDIFATRHAITTGGGFPIINRLITVIGGVCISDDDAALDCHGNSEYVKFIDTTSTGIQLGGDRIKVIGGSVLTQKTGNTLISSRECLGTNFDIINVDGLTTRISTSGVTGMFVSFRNITADTVRGGEINIEGCNFEAETSIAADKGITVENNGSTASIGINIDRNHLIFKGTPLNILKTSGYDFGYLRVGVGNRFIGGEAHEVSGVERIKGDGTLTSADAVNKVTFSVGNTVALAAGASQTIFDLAGNFELLGGTINGTFMAATLTIDGIVVMVTPSNAPLGDDGIGNRFASLVIPNGKCHKSMKLTFENYSLTDQDFGWSVMTR